MRRAVVVLGFMLLGAALWMLVHSAKNPRTGSGNPSQENAKSASPGSRAARGRRGPPSGKGSRAVGDTPSRILFAGPNSLVEWSVGDATDPTAPPRSWIYEQGRLVAQAGGSIAREIATPETFKLSIKFAWGSSLRLRLHFLADSEITQPENCYELVAQSRFVYLRKRWMTDGASESRIIGQSMVMALAEGEEAHFILYVSQTDGRIGLFVDGTRQSLWTDSDYQTGLFGDWVLVHAEENYPLEVSSFVVERWDGILPDEIPRVPGDFPPNEEWVKQLQPPGTWPPQENYQREVRQIRERLELAMTGPAGPARNTAQHEATRALVEAQRIYYEALARLPAAKLDEQHPGHVINPFTGQSLDARGLTSGARIWDPRTGNRRQAFRVP